MLKDEIKKQNQYMLTFETRNPSHESKTNSIEDKPKK
jgi:hypothetical protein